MEKYLGVVYRLHRLGCGVGLRHVAKQSNISASKLSNFENNKIILPKDTIRKLYSYLGMEVNLNIRTDPVIEETVISLYYDISYGYPSVHEDYEKLSNIIQYYLYTDAYLIWLLGDFIYHCFFPDNNFCYVKNEGIIEKYIDVYGLKLKQIFYDALSFYKYSIKNIKQALFYIDQGLMLAISEKTTSMLLFRKSKILRRIGKLSDALECIQRAKILFDKNQNYNQQLLSSIEIGKLYSCLNKHKEAEIVFKQCIKGMKNCSDEEIQSVYCHLSLNSLLSDDYKNAIVFAKQGMKKSNRYRASLNFYLSYSYWKLGNMSEMVKYAKEADRYIRYEGAMMKEFIYAYIKYISNNVSILKKEKLFLAILEQAKKEMNLQLQVIALRFLVSLDFCEDAKKAITYRDELIQVLAIYR